MNSRLPSATSPYFVSAMSPMGASKPAIPTPFTPPDVVRQPPKSRPQATSAFPHEVNSAKEAAEQTLVLRRYPAPRAGRLSIPDARETSTQEYTTDVRSSAISKDAFSKVSPSKPISTATNEVSTVFLAHSFAGPLGAMVALGAGETTSFAMNANSTASRIFDSRRMILIDRGGTRWTEAEVQEFRNSMALFNQEAAVLDEDAVADSAVFRQRISPFMLLFDNVFPNPHPLPMVLPPGFDQGSLCGIPMPMDPLRLCSSNDPWDPG